MTDERIIKGFISGERDSFRVVEEWIREIISRKLWVENISPEEIFSDVQLKLLLIFRQDSFVSSSNLKAFVQTVTRNTLIDCIRSFKRAKLRFKTLNEEFPDSNNQEKEFLQQEELLLFNRIVSHLGTQCRELWKFLLNERLTYKQIAARIETTEATIKMRVFRCKEQAIELRKKLS
ncbi:MAG: sigma-70 family RNA polymerase sigma factor [Ignavibacteriae bacterium]|nr:sigma-70 family RNA polymerase sigma factor [Ignavibacteriota bacterium]